MKNKQQHCQRNKTQHEQKTPPASRTNLPENLEEKAACAASGGQNHPQLRPQSITRLLAASSKRNNEYKPTPIFINLRTRRRKGLGSRCHVTIQTHVSHR
ncbi:hypothetical protein ILYODFUR_038269 [Ilyodon furcidens]|uniref:Uncharacterized protein n=1 Tax=Ilyodon furcidens TaxID=33524 RepID=A0ABV0UNW7_9TELE